MFFRSFLILNFVLLSSCSWWCGDVPNNEVVDISEVELLGDDSDCMDRLGLFFGNYFRGITQDRDVKESFSCVKNMSAKIFEYAEEQSVEKGFSRKEVLTVLKSVFPKKDESELKENVDLLYLVKRLLIGGAVDGFNRIEKKNFDKALSEVEVEVLKSRKNIKFVFHSLDEGFSERDKAYASLLISFQTLDSIRAKFNGELSSKEALSIVNHIFQEGRDISKYKEVALVGKSFLFGPSDEIFKKTEAEFFERIFNVFEVQARIRSVDFTEGFLFGETYYDLIRALEIISGKLKLWSAKYEGHTISLNLVKKLIKNLHKIGVMQSSFSDISLINITVEKVLFKLFKEKELSNLSFGKFEKVIKNWISRQNRIVANYNFSWAKGRIDGLKKESRFILKEINTFQQPQFIKEKGEPILIKRSKGEVSDTEEYFDFSIKHGLYTLAVSFFKAYSMANYNERKPKLSLKEIRILFDDIRPLSLEMGFADPHTCGSADRSFLEADSLTMNGNGNNSLSLNEAVEWVATVTSAGNIASHIFENLKKSCKFEGMKYLGSSFVSRKCMEREVFASTRKLTRYFPTIGPYLDMMSSKARREKFQKTVDSWILTPNLDKNHTYQDVFKNTFNSCGQKDFPINQGELNVIVAVSNYVENVFYQFDQTGSKRWPWSKDPKGSDFMLDSKEVSKFIKAKLKYKVSEVEGYLKKKYPKLYYPFIKDILLGLPESALRLDRITIYKLIGSLLEGPLKKEPHRYRLNYCEDVYRSFKSSVYYNKSERLMCTGDQFN